MKKISNIPEYMDALVLHGIGDLKFEKVKVNKLNPNSILLKVMYCGICSSDIERIFVNGTYHFPTIPGHEFSGQIVAIGDKVDEIYLGKKASVFPLMPCYKCDACQEEEYAQCDNYNYFGSRCDGAYSEYLVIPLWNVILLDEKIDYKVAALCEPAAVSYHACNVANIEKNDNVIIMGTGTIGFLIGIFAKMKGANVFIGGRRKESIDFANSLGFNAIDVNILDKEIKKINKKFNKIFEVVGTNESLTQTINSATNFSTIVVVGNPKDNLCIDKNVYWKILRKQLTIKGTWNSKYSENQNDWTEVLEIMAKQPEKFEKLVTEVYSLTKYNEAFEFIKDKTKFKVKVMFKNE